VYNAVYALNEFSYMCEKTTPPPDNNKVTNLMDEYKEHCAFVRHNDTRVLVIFGVGLLIFIKIFESLIAVDKISAFFVLAAMILSLSFIINKYNKYDQHHINRISKIEDDLGIPHSFSTTSSSEMKKTQSMFPWIAIAIVVISAFAHYSADKSSIRKDEVNSHILERLDKIENHLEMKKAAK